VARFYYTNSVKEFLVDDSTRIFGELAAEHGFQTLTPELKSSWRSQIEILKLQLRPFQSGHIFFEFSIPRMGRRVDNVLIFNNVVFVIEFKVGYSGYDKYALDQVIDYTLDLKNFHAGSEDATLIPLLVVTNAPAAENELIKNPDLTYEPLVANSQNLGVVIEKGAQAEKGSLVNANDWSSSGYRPTPTIVEAARALYAGHKVESIARARMTVIHRI
jgi:hypothetical protein